MRNAKTPLSPYTPNAKPLAPAARPSYPLRGVACPNCSHYDTMRVGFSQFIADTNWFAMILLAPLVTLFAVLGGVGTKASGRIIYRCKHCKYSWRVR